tara:strand:- start:143 stop:508 length:366 start_codon:yes stop_codon:yes gene_type:complete
MKQSIKNIAFALLSTAVLATSAFASSSPVPSNIKAENLVPPLPTEIATPKIIDRHAGRLIKVRLKVDSDGLPHDVQVMNSMVKLLINQIVTAVSQWKFTLATREGVAVETSVVLPLEVRRG